MPVTLNTEEYIPTQRAEIKKQIDKILDDFMIPLMNETIVSQIKILAQAANLPQGFVNGVKFRRTAPNKGEIINTWGTEKKPLAIWFNYGTIQHWIEPLDPDGVLAWEGRSGRNASAIYFQGESKEGDMMFSKGHYVSGIPRTEVMERGFELGKKILAEEAGRIVKQELEYTG